MIRTIPQRSTLSFDISLRSMIAYSTHYTRQCTYKRTYRGENYLLQTGVDALSFVRNIPDDEFSKIDAVIWDPPYMDPDNQEHVERLNHRAGRWKPSVVNWRGRIRNNETRFMSKDERNAVLSIIRTKMHPQGHIIQFHTIEDELWDDHIYRLVWVKSEWSGISGSPIINNGEWINIIGPKVRKNGNTIPKYIVVHEEKNGIQIVRSCAKPRVLFDKIFHLLQPQFVLDPFAGFGRVIPASLSRGAKIYACDIDTSLDWGRYLNGSIDRFFTEDSA